MAILPSSAIPSASGGYTIDQSLRFNDDDSAGLTFTPDSTTGNDKFVFSAWVKRGNLGTSQTLICANTSDDDLNYLKFDTNDNLFWYGKVSGSQSMNTVTSGVFRDCSSWYHIVLAYDSAQDTAGDRVSLYVNGVLQDMSPVEHPSEDRVTLFNTDTKPVMVGYNHSSGSPANFFDGHMAEVYLIDDLSFFSNESATANSAFNINSFGETGDYGEWKPIKYTGTYGDNGFYLPFNTVNDTIIAATGGTIYTSGDYKYHKFTADGTFTVTSTQGASVVDALVIAGGGGGGGDNGGGGGAGGYRFVEEHSVSAQGYSITVGDGGAGASSGDAANGDNSVFSSITATGGGFGGTNNKTHTGADGGSGGGGAGGTYGTEGSGTSGQGNDGGTPLRHSDKTGGGGGGALEAGNTDGQGAGGDGSNAQSAWATITSSGDSGYYAGGGGGGHEGSGTAPAGGSGGGGRGRGASGGTANTAGTANTGGGGGGGSTGAAGGSGIVIIRYKYQ